jgi:uncharacterized protein (DUF1501 family)
MSKIYLPSDTPFPVQLSRRRFLLGGAALGLVFSLYPGVVLADARTEERLVVIILRGAMDGLAALVPYGDPNYAALRGDLALNNDTLRKIDGGFGLHGSLDSLYTIFHEKNLALIHAVASPYRERSHFDAQNVLELGTNQVNGAQTGWLNRLVLAINNRKTDDSSMALAFGDSVPLILRGPAIAGTWSPQIMPGATPEIYDLATFMYKDDPLFSKALAEGIMVQNESSDAMKGSDPAVTKQARNSFPMMAQAAGQFLAKSTGPRIATLELGGWDTHVNQGTEAGRLASNFEILAKGIAAFKDSLGPVWGHTTLVVMTEFGRTVRVNGNSGTDHGTASLMMLAGGRVRGGIYGTWPGLSTAQLYQNRDLAPTTDTRSVMKGVLNDLYGLSPSVLSHDIYPDSENIAPMTGLIRV